MKKTFLISLAVMVLAALSSMAPPNSHAAEFQDTGYVSIEVPDMTQAVKFFADVLGCEPIGPRSRSLSTDARLLVCAQGSVVELATASTGHRPAYPSTPVQLMSDDPVATARSLRQRGVSAVGKQLRLASGHTAVDLTTPWGLRLQLVAPWADSRLSGR